MRTGSSPPRSGRSSKFATPERAGSFSPPVNLVLLRDSSGPDLSLELALLLKLASSFPLFDFCDSFFLIHGFLGVLGGSWFGPRYQDDSRSSNARLRLKDDGGGPSVRINPNHDRF